MFCFRARLGTLDIRGKGDSCPTGYRYKAIYYPEGGGSTVLADNLVTPRILFPNTPVGAGHGRYTFVEYDPVTGNGAIPVPMVTNNEQNSQGEAGEEPGRLVWNNTEYIHSDHLGSTRLITDEQGSVITEYKYYPFGHYADSAAGSDVRMKFTGHERDEGLGLDYMLARYYGANLGRFLSVDPGNDTHVLDPQRWNLYMYGRNNPLALVDPTGEGIIDSVSNFWHGVADKAAAGGQAIASAGQRANDGSAVGVAVDFAASMTGGAIAGAGDALRIGSSTGEAIGSGAGFEGHLRAAGEEAGRVGTWAAALASAGAAAEGAGLGSAEASGARGLGNPFKGKSAGEVDGMFKAKGFEPKGPDPVGGKGGYVNPETGRSYHIDPGGTYKKGTEAPHVDVNRPKGSDLPKKKYEM